MYNLGALYYEEGDKVKAKEWLEKSAVKGNVSAMHGLGVLYYKEGDKVKAEELFEKAAAEGSIEAMVALEEMKKN